MYGLSFKPETLVKNKPSKFHRGIRILMTAGAGDAFESVPEDPRDYLDRHFAGDYGEMDAEDVATNERSIQTGARIMSAYTLSSGVRIWIITDAVIDDAGRRLATTILLPEEY